MDTNTWIATIGAGTLLGDVTDRLNSSGNRAIAHGTCAQVGIGGHATIGGLGPASRMRGAALDHVVEATVVLAKWHYRNRIRFTELGHFLRSQRCRGVLWHHY
jgi:FAD/FMN-containing dehydrogenase